MPGIIVSKHVKYLIHYLLNHGAEDEKSGVDYPELSSGQRAVLKKLLVDNVIKTSTEGKYYISRDDAQKYFARRYIRIALLGIIVIVLCLLFYN